MTERAPLQHDFRLSALRDGWCCKSCGARPDVLPKDWRCPGIPPIKPDVVHGKAAEIDPAEAFERE